MEADRMNRILGVAATTLCAAFAQHEAPAQEGAPEVGLQEVVVTAQKREEKLQDVPISITAVSAEQIEDRGIKSLADLNALAPNVTFRSSPGAKMISVVSIRGSVTGQPAIWVDPSVGLYLNGVYLGKSVGSVFDVVDIERVEVLRGPQGTLFGRNTEGGAINFITRQPSGEFRGNVGVEAGNFDHRVVKAGLDLPRFGIASVSLGARKEERDGWTTNTNGPDFGIIDSEAARASVKLDFSDSFNAIYDFDYSNADNTPWVSSLVALDGWGGTLPSVFGVAIGSRMAAAAAPFVRSGRPETAATNGPPTYERSKTNAHALTLSYELNDQSQFKYIFAKRSLNWIDRSDIDGMSLEAIALPFPPPFPSAWGMSAYFNRHTKYEQDSHELQWVGTFERFRPVVGLYYFKDDGTNRGAQNFTIFGTPAQVSSFGSETDAKAVFAQADYDITDRWTATVGIRYTEEEKKGFTHRYQTNGFDGPFVSEVRPFTAYAKDFSGTTPMAALSFKPTENLNVYARVAKGFKSGGFSSEVGLPNIPIPSYQPQSSVSTELGVKSTLLDGRARLNVSIFNTDITDQQTTQLLPGTTQSLLVNVGESTYRGIEIESALLIAEGWQMQFGYGYLETEFDKFPDNPITCVTNAGGPRCTANAALTIDTASNRLAPYAPEHTANLLLDGRLAKGVWGELRAIVDATYYSKSYLYAVNKSRTAPNAGGQYWADMDGIPSQTNVNARLLLAGIPAGPGTLDVSLLGRNITDEDDMVQGIDFGMFRTAAWREPRTYMATATYKW